ncbi:MAG: choice-of-anchor D domain-containing protein [Acidobacteriia bacterium]|nr:choice-of-anchor D domain-containing protein [Terriglobia bacterium]
MPTSIAVDASRNASITGFTMSSDFPTADPLQAILGISGAGSCGSSLCADAFVSKFGPSGALVYSTFLGGSGADFGNAIAVDSSGAVYVAGSTASQNFPVVAGAPQGSYPATTAGSVAFLSKVTDLDAPGVAVTPQQINFGNQALNSTSTPRAITLVNAGSAPLSIDGITVGGDFRETDNCGSVVPAGGGTCTIQITFTPTSTGAKTSQVAITDNAQGSPQVITVTGTGVTSAGALTPSPASLTFPAETVGVSSPTQVVRLTNTGQIAVTVSAISISGDFSQTNDCGSLPNVLNVGEGCTVSITFTPTASGSRTGSLAISDDAAGSPQAVALSGTGNAVFSLSSSTRSTVLVIGTTSATFTVFVSAPSSFLSSVALSCSSGTTCSFDPSSITTGQNSTLTVSQLSATTRNPFNITVSGSSGTQTATLALTIFFADFSVSAAPPLDTITAGQSGSYTVTVTPTNGFNQVVLLGCSHLPQQATCSWSPSAMILDGVSPATAKVTVNTTSQSARSFRRMPPPGSVRGDPITTLRLLVLWFLALLLLAGSAAARRERGPLGLRPRLILRLAALASVLCLFAFAAGCDSTLYNSNLSPATLPGTPTGVYTITITGTLGNNGSVQRGTSVNLTVGPG